MTFRLTRSLRALPLALGLALTPLAPLPAMAGERPITAEEFRQIDQVLRREGFTRWGDIEYENGRFEVDDAVHSDGRTYDLKLSGVDFSIMERKLDD